MQNQDLQKIQKTIDSLKEAFIAGDNYARMEDLVATLKAVKQIITDLKEQAIKGDTEVLRKVDTLADDTFDQIEKVKKTYDKKHSNLVKEISKALQQLKTVIDTKMESAKAEIIAQIPSMDTMTERHNQIEFELAQIDSKIIEEIKPVKEDIIELYEQLKETEARLNEELKKTASIRSSSGGTRRVFQPYIDRFTSETDGSKKTFYLTREPLKTDTIEVSGTDFPIILDPTVDFTVAGRAVTLTDAVPAPSAGATLIIKYYA